MRKTNGMWMKRERGQERGDRGKDAGDDDGGDGGDAFDIEERRKGDTNESAVVAKETVADGVRVEAHGEGHDCRRDHADDARHGHLPRLDRDGDEDKESCDWIVEEHDLSDATQTGIDATQGPKGDLKTLMLSVGVKKVLILWHRPDKVKDWLDGAHPGRLHNRRLGSASASRSGSPRSVSLSPSHVCDVSQRRQGRGQTQRLHSRPPPGPFSS